MLRMIVRLSASLVFAMFLVPSIGAAQTITEIIDATGDGAGNPLAFPEGIAVDRWGNVYVAGRNSDNAFMITPGGVITEIIDATGDGVGNPLVSPRDIEVDGSGTVYVTGIFSDNAFMITDPGGTNTITEIIDSTGDGAGNVLRECVDIRVDGVGNAYVTGRFSNNAFKIADPGGTNTVTEIIDSSGDGAGNPLNSPRQIAIDGSGNVYVTAFLSNNAFKITNPGSANTITEIIDATGDGTGNLLNAPYGIAVDGSGSVYVSGGESDNAFKIGDPGGINRITEIIDSTGDGAGNPLDGDGGIAPDGSGNVYLIGRGSDNAFKIVFSPWADLGNALAGTHGDPLLTGTGTLIGDDEFTIALTNALENTTAWLGVGFAQLNVPFKSGVLVPDITPPGFVLPLPTGPLGEIIIEDRWPFGVPSGFTTYLQYWIVDGVGPRGFAASNAISGTTP